MSEDLRVNDKVRKAVRTRMDSSIESLHLLIKECMSARVCIVKIDKNDKKKRGH